MRAPEATGPAVLVLAFPRLAPVLALALLALTTGAVLASAGATLGYDYQAYAHAAQRFLDCRPLYDPNVDVAGGFAMLIGRFAMIVPILAIAGSMAAKRRVAPSLGTFPTTGPIFGGLLIGVVVIVGALTYFPALALGPIADALMNLTGRLF